MLTDAIPQTSDAVAAWRRRLGFDRHEAADALGVSFDTYKSYELGKREVPRYIAKLAARLERERRAAFPGAVARSAVHVVGGGTFSHVANHLALAAPGFGTTAKEVAAACARLGHPAALHLTRMADPASALVTNADVAALLDRLAADPEVRVVFMLAALCDYDGRVGTAVPGPYAPRLTGAIGAIAVTPAETVIGRLRRARPDLVVVGSKITTGASDDEQHAAALALLREWGLNLVLAYDPLRRTSLVVTANAARHHAGTDRAETIVGAAALALRQAGLVAPGDGAP